MASEVLGTLLDSNANLEALGSGHPTFLVPPGCCSILLTPLSNYFSSTSRILTLSKLMLWSGWSQFTCFEFSEFSVLDLLCSMNIAFRDLPSPQCMSHHSCHCWCDTLDKQPSPWSPCPSASPIYFQPVSFHNSPQLFGYSFNIWNHNWVTSSLCPGQGDRPPWCLWEHLALPDLVLGMGKPLLPPPLLAHLVEACLPPPATNSSNHSNLCLMWAFSSDSVLEVTHNIFSSVQQNAYHPTLVLQGWLLLKLRYWFECVSFLNTLVLIDPSGWMTKQVSRKARAFSTLSQTISSSASLVTMVSTSPILVHLMSACSMLRYSVNSCAWAFFMIVYVLST